MAGTVNRLTRTAEQIGHRAEEAISGSIQNQIVKLPSDAFLWLALGSIGVSLGLQMMGRKDDALFVGEWAPTFALLGMFSKLLQISGTPEKVS